MHRMPVGGGQYGYRKAARRAEAEERQALCDVHTPQQRLDVLDERLGTNVGAVRERKKLNAMLSGNLKTTDAAYTAPKKKPKKKKKRGGK